MAFRALRSFLGINRLESEVWGEIWQKSKDFTYKSKIRQFTVFSSVGYTVGFGLVTIMSAWEVKASDGRMISLNRVQTRRYPDLYADLLKKFDLKKEKDEIMRNALDEISLVSDMESKKEILKHAHEKIHSLSDTGK